MVILYETLFKTEKMPADYALQSKTCRAYYHCTMPAIRVKMERDGEIKGKVLPIVDFACNPLEAGEGLPDYDVSNFINWFPGHPVQEWRMKHGLNELVGGEKPPTTHDVRRNLAYISALLGCQVLYPLVGFIVSHVGKRKFLDEYAKHYHSVGDLSFATYYDMNAFTYMLQPGAFLTNMTRVTKPHFVDKMIGSGGEWWQIYNAVCSGHVDVESKSKDVVCELITAEKKSHEDSRRVYETNEDDNETSSGNEGK